MKERIYSIPLTDALNEKCGCILCTIEEKAEKDAVSYFLGPSLMEPDSRTLTNDKGFCRRHLNMLLEGNHRLGLALILETHVKELSKKFSVKKSGVFSKSLDTKKMSEEALANVKSCALCEKMNAQLLAAAENLAYLWGSEKDFKDNFEKNGTLCPEHTALALYACEKELHGKSRNEFAKMLISRQKETLDSLYEDLHAFTLSFDYRNTQKPDKKIADAVPRAVKHLTKY